MEWCAAYRARNLYDLREHGCLGFRIERAPLPRSSFLPGATSPLASRRLEEGWGRQRGVLDFVDEES